MNDGTISKSEKNMKLSDKLTHIYKKNNCTESDKQVL